MAAAKTRAMTTKFTGFIGICIFLYLIFVFLDAALTVASGAAAARAEGRALFPEDNPLYSIVLAANVLLVLAAAACGALFWTRRLVALRLLRAFLMAVIAFRIFELVLSFLPEVTQVRGFSAALTDMILVKLFLGIVFPVLLLVYLFRPERKVELDPGAKPRSDY